MEDSRQAEAIATDAARRDATIHGPVGPEADPRPHVVIVGAGFGGLSAARRLRREPVRLTVIDRQNHHLFQPLLYQVATAALSPADIATPIRSVLRTGTRPGLEVLLDEVTGIDPERRRVLTLDGDGQDYDWLVLATGSTYSYFGHDEWAALAPGLKTVEDAAEIRNRLLGAFERAETTGDPALRVRLLTFVLIGGGPTGVEMAGQVAELAKATLARDFEHIDPRAARVVLVEATSRLLPGFPKGQGEYARRALGRLGVEVLTDTPVEDIDERGVSLPDRRIEAENVIWCAGVRASPVGEWMGAPTAKNGAVEVTPELTVPAHTEIFVIGDAAFYPGPDGKPLPALAPVAKQQGEHVAEVIAARVRNRPAPPPFRYRDWGSLATIGRAAAVGKFGRVEIQGLVAWIVWGIVHLGYLVGFRNRMVVLVSWLWAWATYGRGARLITGRTQRRVVSGADQISR